MQYYHHGAHTKYDMKVHLMWVPKYRKHVLVGEVAIRARDVIRQIAIEHELNIISGKVAADHVHLFISFNSLTAKKADKIRGFTKLTK